ncbi:Chloramphenicol phosphotransferase-like protein [Xaviernesmea oryzae]|nr:Chloramphenicol phosphotransferase-like protein [Xaviernesmea oryzae]
MPSPIVILNAAPRSGKSSIARALQAQTSDVWINLGVDCSMRAMPEHLLPGIGLRPGGERPDLEDVLSRLYRALWDSIAAHARCACPSLPILACTRPIPAHFASWKTA